MTWVNGQYRAAYTSSTGFINYTTGSLPMCYMSRFFRYWRGDIKVTLKAVKTSFHSGRILLVWIPQDGNGITPTTVLPADKLAYLHRTIIDLRNESEWTFTLPYCSTSTWKNVYPTSSNGLDSSGLFQIYLLNTLTAPDSCASNINFLVEWSAGENFEFAVPDGPDPFIAPTTLNFAP